MADEEKPERESKPEAGKKSKKKKKSVKIHAVYDISSGLKRKNKSCPKCGSGVFMAQHKDRDTCGKCGYTLFSKKG